MLPSMVRTTRREPVRFERIVDVDKIPDRWITQIKDFSVDPKVYRKRIQMSISETGMLFGLYTPVYSGFLWCEFDPVENCLWINCYSVDQSIWHSKAHLKCLIKLVTWLKTMLNIDKVRWFTKRPGLYRRLGYGSSKTILMEA